MFCYSVLCILLPTAFFASIDRGVSEASADPLALVSDVHRGEFLKMSRGLAIMLLIICTPALISPSLLFANGSDPDIGSRIYLHNPPGEDNALQIAHNAPKELKEKEHHLNTARPKTNVWACLLLLAVTITVMAVTAEFVRTSSPFSQNNAREN